MLVSKSLSDGAAIVPAAASGDAGRVPKRSPGPGPVLWATLLRRVFAIEVLVGARCGRPRQILGAVTEPHAVRPLRAAPGRCSPPDPRAIVPTTGRGRPGLARTQRGGLRALRR